MTTTPITGTATAVMAVMATTATATAMPTTGTATASQRATITHTATAATPISTTTMTTSTPSAARRSPRCGGSLTSVRGVDWLGVCTGSSLVLPPRICLSLPSQIQRNLNVHGVYLHVLGDALGSVAVIFRCACALKPGVVPVS